MAGEAQRSGPSRAPVVQIGACVSGRVPAGLGQKHRKVDGRHPRNQLSTRGSPGFHFGTGFLSHSHMAVAQKDGLGQWKTTTCVTITSS